MRSRRKADNDKTRCRITEGRHEAPPIRPVAVGAPLDACDLLEVVNQTRALAAIRNFALKNREIVFRHTTPQYSTVLLIRGFEIIRCVPDSPPFLSMLRKKWVSPQDPASAQAALP